MKREGDTVLFDSAAQQERVEEILQGQKGAEIFVYALLEAMGGVAIETADMWRRIKDDLGDQIAPDESLSYSWVDRELKVKKYAKEV